MTAYQVPVGDFSGNFRFEIMRRIGAGGIGLVYEAVDRAYGVRVAVKTLRRIGSEELLRFKNEFRLLQNIHHPNLVRLGELFEDGGQWFFSMELVDGEDFLTFVTEPSRRRPSGSAPVPAPLPAPLPAAVSAASFAEPEATTAVDAVSMFQSTAVYARQPAGRQSRWHRFDEERLRDGLHQLATGLHALHRAGMVHRDIKPSNVMVSQGRVVLLDFGLVDEERPWHRYEVEHRRILGTPAYMAPEQIASRRTMPASDWYAVGVMLYEALTGTKPFRGDVLEVLQAKRRRDPVPPSRCLAEMGADHVHVPADLEALCMQLLARDPAARPAGTKVLARLGGRTTASVAVAAVADPGTERSAGMSSRADELAALHRARHHCAPDRPAVAFVHGAAGMGKTVLLERFAREVSEEAGALVLHGRCYERETVPYKALDRVVDELSRYLRQLLAKRRGAGARPAERGDSADIEAIRDLVGAELPALVRLFPVLGSVLDHKAGVADAGGQVEGPRAGAHLDRDAGALRRRAFAALKRLLVLVAARQPLVIVIDDLQWGDLDSVALLSELISPPDAPGLLLVTCFRGEDAACDLVASLRASAARALGRARMHEIEVGPLSEDDSYGLALDIWRDIEAYRPAGKRSPERTRALARVVARESGGSPLLAGEMMRYLALSPLGKAGVSTIERSPITVEGMLMQRRAQLDAPARMLLDVVAVAGRPIAQGVALRAAGLDGDQLAALEDLRAQHLMRTHGAGLGDPVEVYHGRIRAAVLAVLSEDELRAYHNWLVVALESWGRADAEMLTEHLRGAGRLEQAAAHALQAAESAEHALAFARAARMLRLVLDIREAGQGQDHYLALQERGDLYRRLGEALANAGLGEAAATAYLEAAALQTRLQQMAPAARLAVVGTAGQDIPVEYRRRAAEQLLRSGNIEQGAALLRQVLAATDLRVPCSGWGTLLSLALRRVHLRLRGLAYDVRPPGAISARERQRADACWTSALGLGPVDSVRAADFTARCLLMALQQGDETRVALSLALEIFHLALRGDRSSRKRAEVLMRAASEAAHRSGDARALGFATFAAGAIAVSSGQWLAARKRLDRAEEILRERCAGVSWEVATVRVHQAIALFYRGDWGELRARTSTSIRQAVDRGDRYGAGILAWFAATGDLCGDDVARARRTLNLAAVHWTNSRYHMQDYFQLLGNVHIALYEGDPETAWAVLSAELPRFRRSLLVQTQIMRIETAHLHACTALALAAATPARARGLVRVAARQARRMERERTPWGNALAALVRAGVAACRGQRARAVELLAHAVRELEAAELLLLAACARRQQGRLMGGLRGRALVMEADAAIGARGVRNPAAVAGMLAPGFRGQTVRVARSMRLAAALPVPQIAE